MTLALKRFCYFAVYVLISAPYVQIQLKITFSFTLSETINKVSSQYIYLPFRIHPGLLIIGEGAVSKLNSKQIKIKKTEVTTSHCLSYVPTKLLEQNILWFLRVKILVSNIVYAFVWFWLKRKHTPFYKKMWAICYAHPIFRIFSYWTM